MTFQLEEAPLRTDESVANQDDENHHKDVTPFREITSKLLSQFPLEPMHLVYLGVFRRFFSTLLKLKQKCTLKANSTAKLSVYVGSLRPYFPTELTGKPRPIEYWSQYKAAEWRRLGLNDGFLVFKFLLSDPEVPSREKLKKLPIMISCAIRILSDEKLLTLYRNEADILLRRFVEKTASLFGQDFNVFNVHSLIHLSAETLLHGTLDEFSAWIYESYLGTLKKLLRKPGKTLEQIVCRLMEQSAVLPSERSVPREAAELSQPHHKGPTFGPSDQFQMISLHHMIFRVTSPNDICFVTKKHEVCIVRNIIKNRNEISLVCNAFLDKADFLSSPLSSQLLGICTVKRLSALRVYPLGVIKNKAVLLRLHEANVQEKPTCHWMDHVDCLCLSMFR